LLKGRQAGYTGFMAVYTELSLEEIRAFLSGYSLPPLEVAEGIRAGVENTNYLLKVKGGEHYILTLFEKRVAAADLPFFMGLMQQLAERGVPCPMPLRGRDGSVIRSLKGRPAVIVTFLEGKGTGSIQNAHMSELGTHMARMHLAAEGYTVPRQNALSLAGWEALLKKVAPRADAIAPGLAHELEEEMRALADTWPMDLPRGVIHADLFPDNVFYNAQERLTGIIDFYFACNDFLAYDLAICLNAWCFEKIYEFNITKARLMLRAYHEARPLSEAELGSLPVLARGAAFRFLLTRAHDWLFRVESALVTPHDPLEYLKKLRFHRSVTHHREYGL
jgi:homoserine kinase type II